MIAAIAELGCSSHADPMSQATAGEVALSVVVEPMVTQANRCRECHGSIYAEWRSSRHAIATTSATYRIMQRQSETTTCGECHAPIETLAEEGVTCEGCHRIVAVTPDRAGARFTLDLSDNRELGSVCAPSAIYFHKSGCSPVVQAAAMCGSCHSWTVPAKGGGDLPIVTEFGEWQASTYRDTPCQSCHMPGTPREVATGAGVRPEVAGHLLLGTNDELRTRAVQLAIDASRDGSRIDVSITVTNTGAGHTIPSGLSGRQLILVVRVVAEHDEEIDRCERVYSRVLVDASGVEAPFYRADHMQSDKRIAAGATRVETCSLRRQTGDHPGPALQRSLARSILGPGGRPGFPPTRIIAQLLSRQMSPVLATAVGAPLAATALMAERSLAAP